MKLEVRYPGSLRRRPPGSQTEHSTPIPEREYLESSTTTVVLFIIAFIMLGWTSMLERQILSAPRAL